MKIFLIGMPGAGKSTLGKDIASKLMMPFFDLDKEIEKNEKRAVQDIFQDEGEAYFRLAEASMLRDLSNLHHSFIMATGGGTPCFHQSLDFMLKVGKVLFLDLDVETLFKRVKGSTDRPLLALQTDQDIKQRLESLRAERLSFYQRAHETICEQDLSTAYVLNILIRKEIQP